MLQVLQEKIEEIFLKTLNTVYYGPKEKIGVVFDGEGTLPAWPYSAWITRQILC